MVHQGRSGFRTGAGAVSDAQAAEFPGSGSAGRLGVLDYGFWRDPAQPGRYLIRERYADQAAVDVHMALADVVAFTVLLPEWLTEDSHALLETTTDLTRIPFSR
ncbi:putative quinol monooxygenase [Nocardia sp. NPDC059246]|uniref:putative quinol monooxygenase n=1 Tax=unclassified Nocardia TaxID=2637762 RepID=UPI0036A34AB0